MFRSKIKKPTNPKEEYLKKLGSLLDRWVKGYKHKKDSIEPLAQAFVNRVISEEVISDDDRLSVKTDIEEALQGDNASWASEAIAIKLEELLSKHPIKHKYNPNTETKIAYHCNKLTERILPHLDTLPVLIMWIYKKTLKKNKDTFNTEIHFNLAAIDYDRFKQILMLFKIEKLVLNHHAIPRSFDDSKWASYLSLLSTMKVVTLNYDEQKLYLLSDDKIKELAKALESAKAIKLSNCKSIFASSIEQKMRGRHLKGLVIALLANPELNALEMDDFDEIFAAVFFPFERSFFYDALRHSNVVSLLLTSSVDRQSLFSPPESKEEIEKIIAHNIRHAAVAKEHGGLKYLVGCFIWNNPEACKLYEENISQKKKTKKSIPNELEYEVNSLNRHGLLGYRNYSKKLAKQTEKVTMDDIYKPTI